MMEKVKTTELLKKIKKLPPLNAIARRLAEVTRQEDVDAKVVTDVLSSDQAIASKVLALVNSSFYGFPQRISTISRAVVILGNKSIQNLALGFASMDAFKDFHPPFDRHRFWQHSIAVATAAQQLAARKKYPVPEEAFIAGLLHDIGTLILGVFHEKEYQMALEDGEGLLHGERETLGITHAECGKRLLSHWKLPPSLCQVVGDHHQHRRIQILLD